MRRYGIPIAAGGVALAILLLTSQTTHRDDQKKKTIPYIDSTVSSREPLESPQQSALEQNYRLFLTLAGKPKPQILEVLRSLGTKERRDILNRICSISRDPERARQLHELFSAWAMIDPLEAFAAAQTLVSASERRDAARDVFSEASPQSSAQLLVALEHAQDLDTVARQSLADIALIKLSQIDTVAATRYIDDHPTTNVGLQTASKVAESFGKSNGKAAITWAEAKAKQYGDVPLQGAVAGWGSTDLNGATNYVKSVEDDTQRTHLSSTLANRIAMGDFNSAVQWSRDIKDPAEREIVNMAIAAAAAHKDPASAAAWVQSLPTDERTSAISVVASEIAKQNPGQAANWVSTLGTTSDRDAAAEALASQLVSTSPADAVGWALQVSEPDRRTNAFLRAYQSWLSRDPMRASEWLKTSPLPAETKEYIRSQH